jgi:hypothetical protein
MQPITKLIAEKAESHNKCAAPINTMITFIPLPRKIMLPNTPNLTRAPLSPIPSPHPAARRRGVSPAGSEPAPRWIKNPPRKRTRMAQIKRIFTDFPIRANPRHPRNPCSTSASLFVNAPEIHNVNYLQFAQTINLRLSVFICGSFFAEAPDINRSVFINNRRVKYFSAPGTPIQSSCASLEQKYAWLQWW